jgi:hypothetical protein
MLEIVCGVPLRRVSRYAGTDVTRRGCAVTTPLGDAAASSVKHHSLVCLVLDDIEFKVGILAALKVRFRSSSTTMLISSLQVRLLQIKAKLVVSARTLRYIANTRTS